MNDNFIKKSLAIGIIILFVGTCIIPLTTSKQIPKKNIITVDDEPGDADFTSIKDAVNSANPGDTIEVYSGTYYEGEISMKTPKITLKGVPYELGSGNDTGKPIIVREGSRHIFWVEADHIIISGFIMQDNISENKMLYQGHFIDVHSVNGCLISNNTIQNGTYYSVGIDCYNTNSVHIIDNIIDNMDWNGISFTKITNAIISGNSIINSRNGISIDSSEAINITKNKINGCGGGIQLSSSHNITLYLNNIESNSIGLSLTISKKNIIKQNNFINNSRNAIWTASKILIIQPWKNIGNSWIENYWDNWIKIGPKIIPGLIYILIAILPGGEIILPIVIPIPFFQLDRYPAQKPYDIGG
jgi:parallel beta-helix repeat protein